MKARVLFAVALLAGTALAGCDKVSKVLGGHKTADVAETAYPERVYWGDTHLHTANSVDAFGFGNRLGPEEALRFARGEEVTSSTGIKAKLARPLDFLVITDHAEGMGSTMALYNAPRIMIRDPQVLKWYDMMHEGPEQSVHAMVKFSRPAPRAPCRRCSVMPRLRPNARTTSGTPTSTRLNATTNRASSPP